MSITILIQEPIWNYFSSYNLCNPSPSRLNGLPPLTNHTRNDALDMADRPILVLCLPLVGLTSNSQVYRERSRCLRSWWSSQLFFTRTLIGNTCSCPPTPIFHLLDVSPQDLDSLICVSWPFKNIDFEVIWSSDGTACEPWSRVERALWSVLYGFEVPIWYFIIWVFLPCLTIFLVTVTSNHISSMIVVVLV